MINRDDSQPEYASLLHERYALGLDPVTGLPIGDDPPEPVVELDTLSVSEVRDQLGIATEDLSPAELIARGMRERAAKAGAR